MASKKNRNKEILVAEARFLGVAEEVYLGCNEAEREVIVARYARTNAKKVEAVRASLASLEPDGLVKTNSASLRQRRTVKLPEAEDIDDVDDVDDVDDEADVDDEEEDPPYEMQGSTKVYHDAGSYAAGESAPLRRDGPTTGPITERERPPVEDLVGDRAPRTLTDLYARWPITSDSEYFLRIERTLPKRHMGMDVTGLVAEIRGRKVTEADIQRHYGGKEYKVTLYGPDPRGRSDGEGNLVIKALTDAITITVPVLPPIITALPQETTMSMNPFGQTVAAPTSTGDAQIHKANATFFADVVKLQQQDSLRREGATEKATASLLTYVTESQKTQAQQAKEDAERREAILKEQLEEKNKQLALEKAAQSSVATEVARAKDESSKALMEFVQRMGPDKEAEIRRLSDYYTQQVEVLRRAHDDQFKSLQSRHESDLRRADERVRDTEASYRQMLEQERTQSRQMLEQERSQWSQRERDLRDQMEKQTDNERKVAQQRIDDMKERHAAEIRQMEKAHERELRTIKDAETVKTVVSEKTHAMSLQHAEERLAEAQEAVALARAEAEEAKDLTSMLEKAERQAELLGFEKKDAHEPKGPWERFAATAGAGLSQAFANADTWLPGVMAARQQQQQTRALAANPSQQPSQQRAVPQQQRVPQEQQQPRVRRTRGAQWAAEGVQVQSSTEESREPMGFVQQNPAPRPVAQGAPVVETPVVSKSTVTFPQKFLDRFPAEALVSFITQSEQAVNNGVDASVFADLMLGQFSDGAATLTTHFTAAEVLEALSNIPGSEASPLLRRDGRKWMERLFSTLKRRLATSSKEPIAAS